MQIFRASELSRANIKTIQGKTVEEVHAMKRSSRGDKRKINCNICGQTHEKNKRKCVKSVNIVEKKTAVKCKSKAEGKERTDSQSLRVK